MAETWEFTPISYRPEDLRGAEVVEYDRENLAGLFGVPSSLFRAATAIAVIEDARCRFIDAMAAQHIGERKGEWWA